MIISKDMQWKIRDCFDYLAKTITRLTWVYKTTVKNNTSLLVKHRHTFDFEIKPTDHMKVCGGSSYAEVPTDAIRMKTCLINPDRRFASSRTNTADAAFRVTLHSLLHRLKGRARSYCENPVQSATSSEVFASPAVTGRASAPWSVSQRINVADCNRGEGQALSERGLNILTRSLDGALGDGPASAQAVGKHTWRREVIHANESRICVLLADRQKKKIIIIKTTPDSFFLLQQMRNKKKLDLSWQKCISVVLFLMYWDRFWILWILS